MRRAGPRGTGAEPTRAVKVTTVGRTAVEKGRYFRGHDILDLGARSRQDCKAHMQ